MLVKTDGWALPSQIWCSGLVGSRICLSDKLPGDDSDFVNIGSSTFHSTALVCLPNFLEVEKTGVWGKPPHHTFLLCIVIAGTSPRKGPQIQASPARKRLKKHVCAAALLQESMAGSGSHSPLARSKHPFCMISTHFLSCPRKPASDFKTTNHGGKG